MQVRWNSKITELKARLTAAIEDSLPKAGESVLSYLQVRFASEDSWPSLAPRTVKERRSLGFGPEHPILRRLEVLYGALFSGRAGNVFNQQGLSITVGIGGSDRHPGYGKSKSTLTILEIATIHQFGSGNVPRREIIVMPDDATLKQVADIITDAVNSELV